LNKAETAGKIAIWIETQQVVSVLDRAQIATLDREIEEAISEIDEATDDIDDMSEEIDNLLREYE
jgi:predicted  nucleic acid-binding Zn-ribbon protein